MSSSSQASASSFRREVLPEALEALVAAEERRKDRRVREQDVAGAIARGRHPEEHVELAISGVGERMRLRRIDRLTREDVNRLRVIGRSRRSAAGAVKDERLDALEPAARVEVVRRSRAPPSACVPGSVAGRKPLTVYHRNPEAVHQRTRVRSEALLARHEPIAVMEVFDVAHLRSRRETPTSWCGPMMRHVPSRFRNALSAAISSGAAS